MQFTIDRDAVVATIAHVARRAKGGSIPIYQHVIITADDTTVALGGHDGDASSSGAAAAAVAEPGTCVVPGEQFLRLVERMPKGSHVKFKHDSKSSQAEISCGRSRYKLSTLATADFPPMLAPDNPVILHLSAEDIATIFDGPRIFIKDDEARINYAGIYFHPDEDGMISGCATDGATLIKSAANGIKFPEGAASIIIPRRAIDEILKTAGADGGEFSWSDKLLMVKSGDRTFCTKLIDAQFPDYAKYIPAANGHYIKVAADDLRDAIYRLQAVESGRSFISLKWGDAPSELSASIAGNGEGDELLECEAVNMDAGTVAVSTSSMTDIANALGGKTIKLHIQASNLPFRVSCDDKESAVVMQAPIVGRGM